MRKILFLGYGSKKYFGICKYGKNGINRRIDIMYTSPQEYPFAILYFTGSSNFNKKMREHALELGYSMNEHGMYHMVNNKKGDRIAQICYKVDKFAQKSNVRFCYNLLKIDEFLCVFVTISVFDAFL